MSHEFGGDDPHAALAAAKDQFRQTMLEDDAFAAIAIDRISSDQPSGLPSFGCEPT